MVVGDKTPKQSPVKVFQFASKFVGYNHFASVLRVNYAYLLSGPVTLCTSRLKFLSFFNFENTVNFSMDSTAKFPHIRFSEYLCEKSSNFQAKPLIREIISRLLNTFQNN